MLTQHFPHPSQLESLSTLDLPHPVLVWDEAYSSFGAECGVLYAELPVEVPEAPVSLPRGLCATDVERRWFAKASQ